MKRNNIFDMPKTKYYNAEISRYWYHNETFMAPALYLTLGHESGVDPSQIKMTSSRQKSADICYMLFLQYSSKYFGIHSCSDTISGGV